MAPRSVRAPVHSKDPSHSPDNAASRASAAAPGVCACICPAGIACGAKVPASARPSEAEAETEARRKTATSAGTNVVAACPLRLMLILMETPDRIVPHPAPGKHPIGTDPHFSRTSARFFGYAACFLAWMGGAGAEN